MKSACQREPEQLGVELMARQDRPKSAVDRAACRALAETMSAEGRLYRIRQPADRNLALFTIDRNAFESGRPLPDWTAGKGIRAGVNCCICTNNFPLAVPSLHCARVRKKITSARELNDGVMREGSGLAAWYMPLVLDRCVLAAGCQSANCVRLLERWRTTLL